MKILLAVDGSNYSLVATKKCCEFLANRDDLEVKIVSVADISRPTGNMPFGVGGDLGLTINSELKKIAETNALSAKDMVEKILGDKTSVEVKVLSGSPKVEIVEEAKKWGADLIVVGSHGYGFFERMLIGSVSNAVLHHAHCSVLVIKTNEDND